MTVLETLHYNSARGRWVITATVLGSGIAALDATVVNIALPTIGKEFEVGLGSLQWVVNGYTLTLAGLLLLGGSLGDRFGRRRIFLIGVTWFALASLLCAVSPNAPFLISARLLQGVGGALLTPASLAILQASFAPGDRSKAIGAWSGLGGVAVAIGPFIGGYLIHSLSWRLIFFINLPLAVTVLAVTLRYVPETRDPGASRRIDVPGAVLAAMGLAGVTYGLTYGPDVGWTSTWVALTLGVGILLLLAFVAVELRIRAPLLPMSMFRSAQFSATNLVTFTVYGALGAMLFLLPLHLQQVAGFSPIAAGTALLPVTILMLLFSSRSGDLAARIGPRLQMSTGPLVVAVGMALLFRIGQSGNYLTEVLPPVLVIGAGLAITVAPLTSTALSSAPMEHAGIASAVNNDVARVAGLFAVAVLPPLAGLTAGSYLDPNAFARGFRIAILIAAATCALGGLLAVALIRNPTLPTLQAGQVDHAEPHEHAMRHCALDSPPATIDGHSAAEAAAGST
ncbi:MAG: MFS transporter [Mycobacteriales bacterium]